MLKRFTVLALAVLATACAGTPEAGDPCTPEGGLTCDSTTLALFCESGAFRAVPCRGGGGCVAGSDRAVCDLQKAVAGDACPRTADNSAQCEAANPNRLLKCISGTWTAQPCNACAAQGTSIVCQP